MRLLELAQLAMVAALIVARLGPRLALRAERRERALGQRDERLMREVAGGDEQHARRGVVRFHVIRDRVAAERLDDIGAAQKTG